MRPAGRTIKKPAPIAEGRLCSVLRYAKDSLFHEQHLLDARVSGHHAIDIVLAVDRLGM